MNGVLFAELDDGDKKKDIEDLNPGLLISGQMLLQTEPLKFYCSEAKDRWQLSIDTVYF